MIQLGGGGSDLPGRPNGHGGGQRVELFRAWLVRFGDAWEARDPDAITALFGPGATFQPDPFAETLRGKPAIRAYWAGQLAGDGKLDFRAEVLGAGETHGLAHLLVSGPDTSTDGILMAAFDAAGRCTSLRQWWHAGPPSGDAPGA